MSPKSRKLLAPALSLSLLACAFTFDGHDVQWFWIAQPGMAVLLAAGAAVSCAFLILSLHSRRRST